MSHDSTTPRASDPQPTHPIQVVVQRTGVPADTLRAWERRYTAVSPARTETGRRLYTDEDVQRIRLIREATEGGRRVSDVANLPTGDLERIVAEDRARAVPGSFGLEPRSRVAGGIEEGRKGFPRAPLEDSGPGVVSPEDSIRVALSAVRRAEQRELQGILKRGLLTMSPARFITDVVTPLMSEIGSAWQRGDLWPGHEHLATEAVRRVLTEALDMLPPSEGAPMLVVATPSGQRHDLGALIVAATAALEGWGITYLGPDLPASAIGRVATDIRASAVALSVTWEDPGIIEEIGVLRGFIGPETPVLVGGRSARSSLGASPERAVVVDGLDDLRQLLRSIAIT